MLAARTSSEKIRGQFHRLTLAMRRDLGESTFGLQSEDLCPWVRGGVNPTTPEEEAARSENRQVVSVATEPAHQL
jgi:hypothetical protein